MLQPITLPSGKEVKFSVSWSSVSVQQFMQMQLIEDELLPLFAQMQQTKQQHTQTSATIERLFFAPKDDEFAELELAQARNTAAQIEADYAKLQTRYEVLSGKRAMVAASLPPDDIFTTPHADAEVLKTYANLLFAQEFSPQEPQQVADGVWQVKAAMAGKPQNVKSVFYARHLADYPTCLHLVYHALVKQIAALAQDARMERTQAEVELASLFLLPQPTNIIEAIFGSKPDRLDFSSGKFNEHLQKYWDRQKEALLAMPITLLKGVIAFFLPHWTSYFNTQNPMAAMTISTDTEMF